MERLAALEAEVKADGDAQRARKEAALAKVREQRAAQLAEKQALSERQASIVKKKPAAAPVESDDDDSGLGSTLALAKRVNSVKTELEKKGAKSWLKSGLASTALGPLGWLYAGSFREAIPASAAWLVFAAIASHLPSLLLMPVLLVAMPLSGIAGAMYAVKYNRKGARQRIFKQKAAPKSLPASSSKR